MPNWEAYAEAYKRGILPPDKVGIYEEAVRRGLVSSPESPPSPGSPSSTEPKSEGTDLARVGSQVLGGMVGGAIASPGGITTPVGIGLGSAVGGQIYDRTKELFGGKKPDTALEAGMTAAEDFVYDVVSPLALSKGIYAAKKVGGAVLNKARASMFPTKSLSQFQQFGVKPTAAPAVGSKGFAIIENALGDFPLSSRPLQQSAKENMEALKFSSEYLAKEYGPILTKEELGRLLQGGARGAMDRLDDVYGKLFRHVSQQIGENPQVLNNTRQTLTKLAEEAATGPESGILKLGNDIINKADAQGGGLPFEAIKKFRSKIGDMMKDPSLISTRDIQSGDLKRLYGALSKDMEEAAVKAGPKAHASWRAANKYFEISINQKVPILEEIVKKGYSEDAYNILMKSSEKGGSRLRTLRRQMPNEEWNAVSGTIFGKLGMATPGMQGAEGTTFSVNTFLTNWNKLAPEAKTALWAGTKHQELYKQLNEFASVAGDLKSVEALANKSKTGSVLMFFSLYGALGGAVGGVAGRGVGGAISGATTVASLTAIPYVTAKLFTNQHFVKWLTSGIEIAKTNPNAMTVHLGRLFALREKENIREEIDELIKTIPTQ